MKIKVSTSWMKSQDEKLQELKQKAKVWETTQRKWVKALLFYKQQHEALDKHVKTLTKEKKKENALTNLELVNLNNASLLNSKSLKEKQQKQEK